MQKVQKLYTGRYHNFKFSVQLINQFASKYDVVECSTMRNYILVGLDIRV